MNIHCFQHVPFEGLGSIEKWIRFNEHQLTYTKFYKSSILPDINNIDWLIVMGGPMGVYDEPDFPWLKIEKEYIKEAINKNKVVLGICLGAQIIADVLGAKIYKNNHNEIGWHVIRKKSNEETNPLFYHMPNDLMTFHWHSDTFELPDGAIGLAESDACKNQGFIYGDRVIALQFHLETNGESVNKLISNCSEELIPSNFVQPAEIILSKMHHYKKSNIVLEHILNNMQAILNHNIYDYC